MLKRICFATFALAQCFSAQALSQSNISDQSNKENAQLAKTAPPAWNNDCEPRERREFGDPNRAWLGVSIEDVSPSADNDGLAGVRITEVRASSPAAEAGVAVNDVIIELNGDQITDRESLTEKLWAVPANKGVQIVLFRNGTRLLANVIPASGPQPPPMPARRLLKGAASGYGITFQNPTAGIVEAFGLSETDKGLVIIAVDQNCAASRVLIPGDVMLELNWTPVTDPEDAVRILSALKAASSNPVQVQLRRGASEFYESLSY